MVFPISWGSLEYAVAEKVAAAGADVVAAIAAANVVVSWWIILRLLRVVMW